MKGISANTVSPALSVKEIGQFHRDGFVGPFTLAPPEAMAVARERIEKEVLDIAPKFKSVGAKPNSPRHYRHLDCSVVYKLCSHPAIVNRLAALYGTAISSDRALLDHGAGRRLFR